MNHFKKFLLYSLKKRSKQLFSFSSYLIKYSKHFLQLKSLRKASDNLYKKRSLGGFSCGL
ncbi:hypothetical protein HMPREF1400_00196 [Helicobacter pylori GAM119Bi]|uniref:hypothetical protein n=1 Tax=Helicobacter pylori TaxID=210 RepID=UPI0002BBC6C8|nr:hypothetical protein [Helicobacter pylori]EMG95920.1 hypothetical protein HMPREF1400_00196 [Helicobacter pylori GAM119Bi]